MSKSLTPPNPPRRRGLFLLFLGVVFSTTIELAAQVGVVPGDTANVAIPVRRAAVAVKGTSLYYKPWASGWRKLATSSEWQTKWDSVKAVTSSAQVFQSPVHSKGLVSSVGLVSFSGNWVQMMDTYGVEMPEIIGFPNTFGDYGADKQAIMNRGGSAGWDYIQMADVTGLNTALAGKQNTITGLTSQFYPKWSGTALVNGLLYEASTSVRIGTAPYASGRFVVTSASNPVISAYGQDAQLVAYNAGRQFSIALNSAGDGWLQTSYPFVGIFSGSLYLQPGGGNVGIGQNTATERLDVNGSVKYAGTLKPSNIAPKTGQYLKATSPTANTWDYVVDTLAGRPILKMPTFAGDLLPEDHHIVIESDFIPARTSGNSYFDTLRLDYGYYNLLKDSVELVLPLWDTSDVKGEVSFNITFFGWDNDSAFYWLPASTYYKKIYSGSTLVDSVLVKRIQSILYFSQPVNYDIYRTNYLSHNHPNYPFRIPEENSPMMSFTLVYNVNEQKYYLR